MELHSKQAERQSSKEAEELNLNPKLWNTVNDIFVFGKNHDIPNKGIYRTTKQASLSVGPNPRETETDVRLRKGSLKKA
jgi:hypothetical protein